MTRRHKKQQSKSPVNRSSTINATPKPTRPQSPPVPQSSHSAPLCNAVEVTAKADDSQIPTWMHTFALDILDKQYRLYSWNDAKSLSLITANSLLLALLGLLFKDSLQDVLSTVLIGVALVCVVISLVFSLTQVLPQMSSGKSGEQKNLRAMSGIGACSTWKEYSDLFLEYSQRQATIDTLRQIFGMTHQNNMSRRRVRNGVAMTFVSLTFSLFGACAVALASNQINLLGKWRASQKNDASPVSAPDRSEESKTITSQRKFFGVPD